MVLVELNQQKTEREAVVNFIFRRCIWVEWTLHAVLTNTDQSIMEIILVIEALTNDLYIAGYILCVNKRSLETVYYHCRVVFGVNQDSWFFFIFFYCLTSYFMPLKKAWYTSHVKPILQFFFRNWHRYFQIECKSL